MHVLFFLGYGHMDDRKPKRESTGGCALVQLLQVSVFQFQFQHDFHLRMLSSNFVQEFSSGRDADRIGVIGPGRCGCAIGSSRVGDRKAKLESCDLAFARLYRPNTIHTMFPELLIFPLSLIFCIIKNRIRVIGDQ